MPHIQSRWSEALRKHLFVRAEVKRQVLVDKPPDERVFWYQATGKAARIAYSAWPFASCSDRYWHRNIPRDVPDRAFRFGVRRGLVEALALQEIELADGRNGVLEALRAMAALQRTGPILLHHWVAIARGHRVSWGAIARQIGVRRQTAHERYSRPLRDVQDIPNRALSTSVQVARDLAREPWEPRYGENPWSMAESGLWDRLPPRDQADLAALNRVILSVEEELAWLVAEARCRGATWAAVGQALGEISRQAVHKRFGAHLSTILLTGTAPLHPYER